MKILTFITILLLGVAASRAQDKPTLAQAKKTFQDADALLSKTLKETSAGLDKAQTAALQKKESLWADFREARSESLAKVSEAKAKLSVDYWTAMTGYTQERLAFLGIYSGKSASPGITGEYKDAYDGDLELEETPDGINFTLSVVRGNAAHTGQISGTAQKKGDKATFKEELEAGQKGPACQLVFSFIEGHIVKIEEQTPDPDAETGVHYDGEYYKTSEPVTQ